MEPTPQFDQLLDRLLDSQIEFVIIGGYASIIHGSADSTQDLDICCAVLTPENIQRLRKVLADLHPKHRMTPQRLSFLEIPREGEPPLQNLYLDTDLGTIDILTNVIGVGDFRRLKSTATKLTEQGKSYYVMSLDDLIKTKETLGRDKDLRALTQLRCIAAARNQPPQK
jgi:hypothetical protein